MSQKILIAEDNDFVRMQIVTFLKEAGYECVEVADGNAALNTIDESFAAAIVDVRMEPLNGFDFVKNLHNEELYTPIVFVTGDQNPDLLSEAGKLGVNAVLLKPVQKERLVQMVERLIKAGPRKVRI